MHRKVSLNLQGLTPPQHRLFRSLRRFIIACWGRQSGKTTCGLYLILSRALAGRQGGIYWYVLQTHSAAEIAFNRFWAMTRGTGLLHGKPNESERSAVLINGATVFFKSGQNFEDLRAETLDGVVIDEYRQQDKRLWPVVIRPMLARFEAWAVILSTPNGFEHFYDLFEAAKLDPEWEAIYAPSTEAWWWTPAEIASSKSTMSEDEFDQEILAQFREMGVGKVYKNHSTENQTSQNPFTITGRLWSPHLPIVVGLDFNVGLMCWELGQFRGRDCFFGEELAVPNTDSQECANLLAEKCKGHPSGLVLIGDASGNSRKTSAGGKTDYSIIMQTLKDAGIRVTNKTPEANPGVKDRVNVINAALKDAHGQRHLFYDPSKCPKFKKDLERVKWKEGTSDAIFDKSDPLLTHASDAAGYPVYHFGNEFRTRPGRMTVLTR